MRGGIAVLDAQTLRRQRRQLVVGGTLLLLVSSAFAAAWWVNAAVLGDSWAGSMAPIVLPLPLAIAGFVAALGFARATSRASRSSHSSPTQASPAAAEPDSLWGSDGSGKGK